MKKLLLLSILFIVGCPPPTAPEPEDCAGVAGGTAELDNCNVCDSDKTNDCVPDCAGEWGGESVVDECGVCGGDGIVGCTTDPEDCAGVAGGTAELDNCNVCDTDKTNDCVPDCEGTWGGDTIDDCTGICGGDTIDDCTGICGGDAVVDECGECGGGGFDVCGTCDGSLIPDCDGVCLDGYLVLVNLGNGVCNDTAGLNLSCEEFNCDDGDCIDCDGVCNGGSWNSDCGCVAESNQGNDCDDCAGVPDGDSALDCDGVCLDGYLVLVNVGNGVCNDTAGLNLSCAEFNCDGGDCLDECGVCGGDGSSCSPTVCDVDGNCYETIQIGEQLWMAENLKVTKYRDGSEIPTGYSDSEWAQLETGAYGVYDDDPSNADIYGNLYNGYAVGDSRGLCMDGFHVPSDEEFMELEMYLGMSEEDANSSGYRGTDESSKLAGNSDLWYDGDLENNSEFGTSGFNGLPAGRRTPNLGSYLGMDQVGYFWSSSETSSLHAWNRTLSSGSSNVSRNLESKQQGMSVRCLGD